MTDNQNEMLPVVDSTGNVIGSTTRAIAHSGSMLLHPVVHLHVFNSNGELYLQKRPSWKDIQPDKWDTACGGHVDLGEDVDTALMREVKEELGISDFKPHFITRYTFKSMKEKELVNVFTTTYNGELSPSEELDGGKFWSTEEISESIGKGVLTPNFENEFKTIILPYILAGVKKD